MKSGVQANPLSSVHAKLRWARKHRLDIRDAIAGLGLGKVEAVIAPRTGRQRWVVTSPPPVASEEIRLTIGDCLYAFRSALDHLAWELDREPGRRTMFPLARCNAELESAVRRIAGFEPGAVATVVNWQPCVLPKPFRACALWALETLINIDKHRHLNVVCSAAGDAFFWDPPGEARRLHNGPVAEGTVLAEFAADQHKSRLSWKLGMVFQQLPPYPGFRPVHSVDGTLFDIDTVVCMLVNEFAASDFPDAPHYPLAGERPKR